MSRPDSLCKIARLAGLKTGGRSLSVDTFTVSRKKVDYYGRLRAGGALVHRLDQVPQMRLGSIRVSVVVH